MQKTNNFLNNQRYIFGEKEKRKVFMLYFGKKRYTLFLNFLMYFSTFLLGFFVSSFFLYIGVKVFFGVDKYLSFIFFLLFLSYIYLSILSFKNIKPIYLLRSYFLLDYENKIFVFLNIVLYILFGLSIAGLPLYLNNIYFHYKAFPFLFWYVLFILLLLYTYSKIDENIKKSSKVLNLVNVLFFPISLLFGLFIYILSYIRKNDNAYLFFKTLRKNKNLYNNFYEIIKK